jgi:histidyl-tRNA synthetase
MKPTIPQGTRDFAPETVRKRQYIFQTIRSVFERYGFQPLETPAMENLDTLMGKYGEEGDKLIFKILNNGLDHPNKRDQAMTDFQRVLEGKSVKGITERALRYDLTIPFARFVAMNHGQLSFPFKRYQIQPVWRADRPQKGRYREFYQCDADVVGSASLINEAELAAIYRDVFTSLGLSVDIRINHRKILAALAERCGGPDQMMAITMAIDKLDKIGLDGVKKELQDRGLTDAQISIIMQFLDISGSVDEKIAAADELIGQLETGKEGLSELRWLLQFLRNQDSPCPVSVDFTLARGLNYYTGTIFEVKAKGVQTGSIGGGGRYDDLTGLFGVSGIPGVGISFGVDRIYDVMEELELFPEELAVGTRVLFFNLGEAEAVYAYSLLQQVRSKGIPAEIYHENSKFDKQFKYAEKKRIPFIVISGSAEMETLTCVVRNLQTGEQQNIPAAELPAWLSRTQV